MSSVNKAIFVGNLGADPELKYTPNGKAVCNFSVATEESWTDQSGQKQESTEWARIVVWGKQAENCNLYLQKGSTVYVEARYKTRTYTDKNGIEKIVPEFHAKEVKFLGKPSRGTKNATPTTTYNKTRHNKPTGTKKLDLSNISATVSKSEQEFTTEDIPF